MKNTITISTLCLVTLILLTHHQTRADLISDTCNKPNVLYKELCEKTLRADPAGQRADINGLVKIALGAASKEVNALKAKIAALLKSSSNDKALKDCAELYDDAAEQISDSVAAAAARRYDDVNTWVSAAMTSGDTCEEGFEPGKSLLTRDNLDFEHLCSNVLAISNQAGSP